MPRVVTVFECSRIGCSSEPSDRGGPAASDGDRCTGSDGHGYQLAHSLGHRITHTTPALVPLVLPDRHWLTGLSGISLTVELVLQSASGKILHRQRGDMLLTHFGLSGPAIMDISRHWIAAHETDPRSRLSANLLPDQSFEEVEQKFVAAAAARAPHAGPGRRRPFACPGSQP